MYDITWSFNYRLDDSTGVDNFGLCLFLQDASVDLEYGGRGVNLGYSGTPYEEESLVESVGLQGGVIGIGMDARGLFGTTFELPC
jgi:hypothetical protein